MAAKPEEQTSRGQEILAMLARIPVELLEERTIQLLNATRHVSQGRDLPMVEEPDNAVRLRVLELVVAQQAGAAGTRKPIEPTKTSTDERPAPGTLRVPAVKASNSGQAKG